MEGIEFQTPGLDEQERKMGERDLLSLAIPFYNEEENAERCIADHIVALNEAGIDFEIIAVDNGSTDATGRILDPLKSERVRVLHVRKNIGYGNGIMQGWTVARGTYLGFTGGDNEVPASSVVRVFQEMRNNGLDLCKGKRVSRGYGPFRRIESFVYNVLFCRLLLGYKHGDINGYPKILRKDLYQAIKVHALGPFFDTELMLRAIGRGARIGSVPVEYKKREKGKSTVSLYVALFFVTALIGFELRRLLRGDSSRTGPDSL